MAIVERGNVVLEIADDAVDHYLSKGYSVTDGNGNILQQTPILSVGELHRIIAKQKDEIEALKKQIQELTEEKPKRQRKAKTE